MKIKIKNKKGYGMLLFLICFLSVSFLDINNSKADTCATKYGDGFNCLTPAGISTDIAGQCKSNEGISGCPGIGNKCCPSLASLGGNGGVCEAGYFCKKSADGGLIPPGCKNICNTETFINGACCPVSQYPSNSTTEESPRQFNYKLLEAFPGFFNKDQVLTDFPKLILSIYKFGIWTVGIAGLFMLVVGGFTYMTSAGNTSTAGSGKKIIWDALLGIAAALGAYLILYVINPDLTRITIGDTFVSVDVTETEGTGGSTAGKTATPCTGTICATCKPGTICAECKNCTDFSNGYGALCYNKNTNCKLNLTLASKLKNAGLSSVGAQVSEAWPPTVMHSSRCHQDGTCADVRCVGGCQNASPESIKKIYTTLQNAGLNPVFENTSTNCPTYTKIGVKCISPETMTAPSFHVNLP